MAAAQICLALATVFLCLLVGPSIWMVHQDQGPPATRSRGYMHRLCQPVTCQDTELNLRRHPGWLPGRPCCCAGKANEAASAAAGGGSSCCRHQALAAQAEGQVLLRALRPQHQVMGLVVQEAMGLVHAYTDGAVCCFAE
jgi:hypothetical protein